MSQKFSKVKKSRTISKLGSDHVWLDVGIQYIIARKENGNTRVSKEK